VPENETNAAQVKAELDKLKSIAGNTSAVKQGPVVKAKPKIGLIIGAVVIILVILVLGVLFFGGGLVPSGQGGGDLNKSSSFEGPQIAASFNLSGTIVDSTWAPVSGVSVVVEGTIFSSSSGDMGAYKIDNISVNNIENKKPIITFKKQGFVPIHKLLDKFSASQKIDIELFPEQSFQKVDPAQQINAKMAGASLFSEANSFVVKGTNKSASTANVSLTPFDPTNSEQLNAFPGDFEGVQKDGSTTQIETYGFMKVQVRDDNGNALDLASGKTAEVVMPISVNQNDTAPDSIPLWYFDPSKGTWVERGIATKSCDDSGCYYKGKIDTIASWWNCDKGIENSGEVDARVSGDWSFWKCMANPVDCFSNWYSKKFGDLTIFDKGFTESPWRLLLDVASIFIEPVNWAYNTWIILNPNTTPLEKVGAVIGMLPLLNASMGMHIAELMGVEGTSAVFHYSSLEGKGLSYAADSADALMSMAKNGVYGSERANVVSSLLDNAGLTGARVSELAIAREAGAVERGVAREVRLSAEEVNTLLAQRKDVYTKLLLETETIEQRAPLIRQYNEVNNQLPFDLRKSFFDRSEAGGIGIAAEQSGAKLHIAAQNIDQVLEAYSNPKVQAIIENYGYKVGLDRAVLTDMSSNPSKGITIYLKEGTTAEQYQGLVKSLNEALDGYSGGKAVTSIPGDVRLGENGVFGRWAQNSDGLYVPATNKMLLEDPFRFAPDSFRQVVSDLSSSIKPSSVTPVVPAVTQELSKVSNLWVTKYAPEYMDPGLAKMFTGQSADFALKLNMNQADFVEGILREPLNTWKTLGYQQGSSAINFGGKSVPLESFEVIPFNGAAYDAAMAAKEYLQETKGVNLIVHDITQLGSSTEAQSILLLHQSLAASQVASKLGHFAGTAAAIMDGKSTGDWIENRANVSFNGASDNSSSIVSKSQSLDFDSSKDHMIQMGASEIVSIDYGDITKTYTQGKLIAEEYPNNPSLNTYTEFDVIGEPTKTITKDTQTTYTYSKDGLSTTKTTTVKVSGYSYTTNISLDPKTKTFTETTPSTGGVKVTRYDDNYNLVYSQESSNNTAKTYEYGGTQSKITLEQKDSSGNVVSKSVTTFDKSTNTSTTESTTISNGQSVKTIISEVYDSNGSLVSRNGKYYTQVNGEYVLSTEDNTVYKYQQVSASDPVNGGTLLTNKLIGADETRTDSNGITTTQSLVYNGNPANQYYDIKTNDDGYVTEISKKSGIDVLDALAKDLNLLDLVKYEYDSLDRVVKETRSDELVINYTYGPDGQLIEVRQSDGKIIHPLTDNLSNNAGESASGSTNISGMLGGVVNAKLVLQGVDYTSRVEKNITIGSDGKIRGLGGNPILGKPGGKAMMYVQTDSVVSEGTPVTIPPAGQSISLELNYGAVVVPIELEDKNGFNSVIVSFYDGDKQVASVNKYLSPEHPSDLTVFLINPRNSGRIVVEGLFSDFSKEIPVGAISLNNVSFIDKVLVGGKSIFKKGGAAGSFNCPTHYAYVKTYDVPKDNNFTMSSNYDALYYDGKEVDRSVRIRGVKIFGNHLAYEKEIYTNLDGNYCGDYSYANSCTYPETHVIYDGKDLGEGSNIQLWGDHIGFKRFNYNGPYDFVYDGKDVGVLGERYSLFGDFSLWGDNYAYETASQGSYSDKNMRVVWNGMELGKGLLYWMSKNFVLVKTYADYSNDNNYDIYYVLYKDGNMVDSYIEYDGDVSVFGDNWAHIKGNDIYLNGKKILVNISSPFELLFGDNIIYGGRALPDYENVSYFNGLELPAYFTESYPPYVDTHNDTLYENKLGLRLGDKKGLLYNGKKYLDGITVSGTASFGNNWIAWDYDGNVFYNGAYVGRTCYKDPKVWGDNYAFVGCQNPGESYNDYEYPLIYNGKEMGKVVNDEFRLFGDNILWEDRGGKASDRNFHYYRFLVDGNVIITDTLRPLSNVAVFPSSGSTYGDTPFVDTYLYCTNQWK